MKVSARISGENARAYATRVIRENIIGLHLAPGSVISENELASELGISRTPVREAIQELQKSSLIEVLPQRGSVIARIDFDIIDETAFMRRVLETAVVQALCESITDEQIAQLQEAVKLQEFFLANPVPDKLLELDNQFHASLFHMCGKARVYGLMSGLMGHFDRVRALTLYVAIKDTKTVSDHRAIVEAIADRDPALAGERMLKHLSRYVLDKQGILDAYPEYF